MRCRMTRRLCRRVHTPFFFFNDTATTEIYTLSLHDALPILAAGDLLLLLTDGIEESMSPDDSLLGDRKSTRLNSSHVEISYAVFCLKKKKEMAKDKKTIPTRSHHQSPDEPPGNVVAGAGAAS